MSRIYVCMYVRPVQEVQDRVTDKRVEVRRTALNGLAKWYNRFIVSSLPPLWEVYVSSSRDVGLLCVSMYRWNVCMYILYAYLFTCV
jgi:hypothetical protein